MKLLVTFLAVIWTLNADAQGLIWSRDYLGTVVGNPEGAGPLSNREIGIAHTPGSNSPIPPSLNPVTGIFSMTISTNDEGSTFFANALNELRFLGFATALTDGVNGYIHIQDFNGTTWGVGSEANVLGRSVLAPDFAGYNITQIGFRVNNYYDWYYEPENRFLNTFNYSLDFYGAPVPEPGTWTLLTLAAASFLLRRKARPQPPAPPK